MKRIVIILLFVSLLLPLSAMDFGVNINNSSSLKGSSAEDLSLNQQNTVSLWFSTPAGSDSSLYLSGLYKFSGSFNYLPDKSYTIVPFIVTAGRMEWEGFKALSDNSSISWSLGRIPFSDYSAKTVNATLDGAKALVSFGPIQVSSALAYTGLTFKEDANIMVDNDDEERFRSSDTGWPNNFATQRLLASIGSRFVEILPKHDFGLDLWAQFDLEQEGSKTHTQYIEPFIEGRVGSVFRWRFWSSLELGTQEEDFFYALAAGARARWTVRELKNLSVTASANFAGGDYDDSGPMTAYKAVNLTSLAMISSLNFSDAMALALDISLIPFRAFNVGWNMNMLFTPGSSAYFVGNELLVKLGYKPKNDFSLNLMAGVFLPNERMYDIASEWLFSVAAVLSL